MNRGDKCFYLTAIKLQTSSSVFVFHKVENSGGGTFCPFYGQSLMCPDHVQSEAQAGEEKAGVAGGTGSDASWWYTAGDLYLGNDEGRERDVGCQRRAIGVDKGFDLLCFFIAGLNLGEENQILLLQSHRILGKVKSDKFHYILTQKNVFFVLLFLKVTS